MTTPDLMINSLTPNSQAETLPILSSSPEEKKFLTLKIIDKLLIAVLLLISILAISFSDNQKLVLYGVISLCFVLILFIINRQLFQESQQAVSQYEAKKKAEIYTYLLNDSSWQLKNFTPVKAKALEYCQNLINDYKRVRDLSRTIYYILQITTVVFSGITPILVLVDKIEAGQTWLKWLPVICPAIASILASIVTSFPFQKNWVAANTVVERLEAEEEKFVLGVTQPYRLCDISDEVQQQKNVSQALEYFIQQVNNIHFEQVQQNTAPQSDKQESTPGNNENQPQPTT
jgi:ABC-type multidrug transport system fused ATPase/permease subunit